MGQRHHGNDAHATERGSQLIATRRSNNGRKGRRKALAWEEWDRPRLLGLRLCDLGVQIEGTWLEECVARLQGELKDRGVPLRPHCWLAEEWFSPKGVPGIAIPFYLAHPRLLRLERSQMLEVEGGTPAACMKFLRHEAGHALQWAFELHRRHRWQKLFGSSSTRYPDQYRPNPASRRFVLHLDAWYAQSHPDEDFAETFAVWLTPRSGWRTRYAEWPARRKLEYVDELMEELQGQRPRIRSRARPEAISSLRFTLEEYYRRKREIHAPGFSDAYDRDLQRLFMPEDRAGKGESAAAFIRRNRREIRELVSRWTGEYQFTLDQVLKEMIGRCQELKLRAAGRESRLKLDFTILLTVHTTHYIYRRRAWHAV